MKSIRKSRVNHDFGPFYNEDSTILILGSFPSVKSREEGFYYSHPQNKFWKVLAAIYNEKKPTTITEKKQFLTKHHIALWDVVESCQIIGSSDASIIDIKPNKIHELVGKTNIVKIFTLGRKAYSFYNKYCLDKVGIEAIYLPSTSPANASISYDELKSKFSIIKQKNGT